MVFAIVALDALWFKADAVGDAAWDAAGAARFTHDRDGQTASMNYRRAPDDVHDDAEALRRWAMLAIEAGRPRAGQETPPAPVTQRPSASPPSTAASPFCLSAS